MPHTHYDGTVCFSIEELLNSNYCSNQHNDLDDCCKLHDAPPHHHTNPEDCNLKDFVLRQSDDVHDEIIPCQSCLSLLYTLYPLNELYLEAPEFGLRFEEKPYLEAYTPPFVGSIKGLRAPPISYFLG